MTRTIQQRSRAYSQRHGAALVIVLAFIVLLSAIVILFFTEATNHRQLADTGFNDFKSSTLGQSALQVVVADLISEIANPVGSTASGPYGSSPNVSYVYLPTSNIYAVPQRSGNPALVNGVDPIPNLIRRSVRSDAIPSPGVGSRASAVNSSTDPALGGQYVSLSRWNKHFLIPRIAALAGTTNSGTTPITAFTAPDWVYVTDQGPDILPSTLTSPIKDANGKTVTPIGRYAYAIYDEGGLLDANVAGFPSDTATNTAPHPSPNPDNLASWGSGLKGPQAFADLTVPVTNYSGAPAAPLLTQPEIDQLVGWRNNATAQPAGNFTDGYTFNASSAVLYHDAMVTATNGFLVTSGQTYTGSAGTTVTDSAFTSRQSLIQFFKTNPVFQAASNAPLDSLQYFATFTRDTDQPSYVPPVGRPMVQSGPGYVVASPTVGKASDNVAPFGMGNDAHGVDRTSTTANSPLDINPPFLTVRVATSFTRNDGTVANVGDPLIKERFPLSKLSLITSTATATQSETDPIYHNFGLYRSNASNPWMYNHDTSAAVDGIDRLNAVASLRREPDFFELLKAAINVGSIGKGCAWGNSNVATDTWTLYGTIGYITQRHDTLTALQILQIGANIIDQSKADNFPTRIQFGGDTTVPPLEVRGSEDLPYVYRLRNWFTQYVKTPAGGTGQIAYLIQPELWDPYAYAPPANASLGEGSSGYVTAANTPKVFRARLEPDPTVASSSGLYAASPVTFTVTYQRNNPTPPPSTIQDTVTEANVTLNAPNYQNASLSMIEVPPVNTPSPAPITFSAGELNGYWGFREPTVLAMPTVPTNANINSGNLYAVSYLDVNTHSTMTGFLISTFPTVNTAVSTSDAVNKCNLQPNGEPSCLRVYLDYQDPTSGKWITYDEEPFQPMNGAASYDLHTVANYTSYQTADAALDWFGWTRTDPRTARWAAMYTEYLDDYQPIDASGKNWYETARSTGGISYGSHLGNGRLDVGFYTYNSYATSATHPYRGTAPGYAPENSSHWKTYQTDADTSANLRYNLDPDGIPRRNMAGYAEDTTNGGVAAGTSVPGLPMNTASISGDFSSRPTILHRPFRSVAELGYAFRETPWANVNFSFPESGDPALLDVFCINDTKATQGLVAGRVDLNTRQTPVLAALLSGALLDKDSVATPQPVLSQTMSSDLAKQLVARTINVLTQGPLMSRADLVGAWTGPSLPATSASNLSTAASSFTLDPNNFYTGFSYDIGTVASVKGTSTALITRQREAVMRSLVDSGTSRTWNLLIDLVAQSGRFPPNATNPAKFVVQGEKHYWLHVAIDRYTGKVIDSQLEVVRE
jgi:hypothetical protein